jgi:hypothetical protein
MNPSLEGDVSEAVADERFEPPLFGTLAGREFAIEGVVTFDKVTEKSPPDLVIRLTGLVTEIGPQPINVAVNENIASFERSLEGKDHAFRMVLRAPPVSGTYMVETIYNHRVIASSTIKVRSRSQ